MRLRRATISLQGLWSKHTRDQHRVKPLHQSFLFEDQMRSQYHIQGRIDDSLIHHSPRKRLLKEQHFLQQSGVAMTHAPYQYSAAYSENNIPRWIKRID